MVALSQRIEGLADEETIELACWVTAESDRKSTRLNSSHGYISYAVFCLKKKKYRRFIRILREAIATVSGVSAAPPTPSTPHPTPTTATAPALQQIPLPPLHVPVYICGSD